jgi:ribosomal protein S18 acetylase RimI-like enzyme
MARLQLRARHPAVARHTFLENTMHRTHHDTSLLHAQSDEEVRSCWPVMRILRPSLGDADAFVAACRRMQPEGYRLLAARDDGAVMAVAGYRIQENLLFGRFLYVDDLVTSDTARGQRWGAHVLDALKTIASAKHCRRLVLDTGLANGLAQRFYFREGLLPLALRFTTAEEK